jgi:hypothetical protein
MSNSQYPDHGLIDGLSRVIRTEYPDFRFSTLALANSMAAIGVAAQKIFDIFQHTLLRLQTDDSKATFVEMDGLLQIPRVVEAARLNHEINDRITSLKISTQAFGTGVPLEMRMKSPGLLDTLHFVEDMAYYSPLPPGVIEVEIKAIGVNFMDCLVGLWQINDNGFGTECAGVVSRVGTGCSFSPGDLVCGATLSTFKTFARSRFETRP